VIRRGFWLGLGAVLGIAGYRRVTRAVRMLTPQSVAQRALGRGPESGQRFTARGLGSETASFARDVRAGMTEYLDAHDAYINRQPGR